jgi:hypothetical protein
MGAKKQEERPSLKRKLLDAVEGGRLTAKLLGLLFNLPLSWLIVYMMLPFRFTCQEVNILNPCIKSGLTSSLNSVLPSLTTGDSLAGKNSR